MSSARSVISGHRAPRNKSRETADETTSSRPAAVESAAASPPAATRPMIQLGNAAISGFASTMMSRSIVSSFVVASPTYWMSPSPFLSSKVIRPVCSHFVNHSGMEA